MDPLRRNLFSVALLLITLGVLSTPRPAEAAGFGDYVTAPFNTVTSVFEGALGALVSVWEPHGAVASLPASENAAALVYVPVPTTTPEVLVNPPAATTTVIYKYVAAPAPSSPALTVTKSGVSQAELTQQLQELDNKLQSQIAAITSAGPLMGQGGLYNEIAASNKIDQLSGVTITNSTIDAASIPNLAGTYLPLSGGTVSGTTAFRGYVGIGNTSPQYPLDITNSSTSTPVIVLRDPLGGDALELRAGTSTLDNMFVGVGAGSANTTGNSNTASGYDALYENTTGSYNTANGLTALYSNTIGGGNTADGYSSLYYNTTGYDNTANGVGTLYSNTTGYDNTGNGYQVLFFNTTGSYNTANGFSALGSNTTGSDNNANGVGALDLNTTGSGNTVDGRNAVYYNGSATSTTALGYQAGEGASSYSNQGGTYVGYQSGHNAATNSNYNTLLGYQSGYDITTGTNNLILGTEQTTGSGITTGSNNILLGEGVDANLSDTGSNQLNIGNLIFGTNLGTNSALSTGDIAIGTSSPSSRLTVWGSDTATTTAFSVVNTASTTAFAVYDNGNATYSGSLFQSSDERLKTDVTSLNASSSLAQIEALNPVSYLRIDQPSSGENLGFLAQQAGSVFPELVSTTSATALTPGGTLTLNYVGLIAPIVGSIQALAGDITSLQQTVAGFAAEITTQVLTATHIHTSDLCITKSDGTDVCITGDQLSALLAGSSGVQLTTPTVSVSVSTSTASTSTAPVLSVNGNNPAEVAVGSTYSDLGAVITGPSADLNLGIQAIVDGGATTSVSQISIDTSSVATHTIEYFATDQNGLTGTAVRTVVVYAPNTATSSSTPSMATSTTTTSTSTTTTSTSTATSTGQ